VVGGAGNGASQFYKSILILKMFYFMKDRECGILPRKEMGGPWIYPPNI
jgi:hypothetical protein